MKHLLKISGVGALLVPLLAGAADLPTPVDPPNVTEGQVTGGEGVIGLMNVFLGWIAVIFWIAAAAFIFYAAFLYLTAAGDPEKVKKASSAFLYGVIAIAVGLLAYALPTFVRNLLAGQ